MPRSYVNNASNRSLGRVGMSVGSMVVSRSGGGGGSSGGGSSGSGSSGVSSSVSTSTRVYADNSSNRNLGRAGLPMGSMVVSKSTNSSTTNASTPKTYVDNAHNRKVGRVGKEYGTSVQTQSALSVSTDGKESPAAGYEIYRDDARNRNLGRVGLPIGSAVYDKKTGTLRKEMYADNAVNRKLNRVGDPKGSKPSIGKSRSTKDVADIIKKETDNAEQIEDHRGMPEYSDVGDIAGEIEDAVMERVKSYLNRKAEEFEWMKQDDKRQLPKTAESILSKYSGMKLPYDDLEMGRKIGQGGFGEVYFAKWKGTVVAVKKLIESSVSTRRLREFSEEIINNCKLDHPNIVKFIGACVEQPNLCIIMEYMGRSLFDALHIEEIEFSDMERLCIIRQMNSGLKYLHSKQIAHGDMKATNILLDYGKDTTCTAKITDFGLSVIKANTETSSAAGEEQVRLQGTPKYSAPEILRGELLTADDRMKADVYSIALVAYEVIYQEEIFYDLNYPQLQTQVGKNGKTPELLVTYTSRTVLRTTY